MTRLLPAFLLLAVAGCGSFAGAQKISGDENQVVLSAADIDMARRHCEAYGKDAVSLGQTAPGRMAYACRPKVRS